MSLHIQSVEPDQGHTLGGNIVKLSGTGLRKGARVFFGTTPARVQLVDESTCYVQAPPGNAGWVNMTVCSGDERCELLDAYRYIRRILTGESDLTRLVRTLLRALKAHVLTQTSLTVDVDYCGQGTTSDPEVIAASLPALILTGPDLRENLGLSIAAGPELQDSEGHFVQYTSPRTYDLVFNLTGTAAHAVEMLNLMPATVGYLHDAKCVTMQRDPAFPRLGTAAWALDLLGEVRTQVDGGDGPKAFRCSFAVRGFDIGASHPIRVMAPAKDVHVNTSTSLKEGGSR